MNYDFGKRLGLSATPERFGDQEGTNQVFSYFGKILEPEITIFDAIKAGRLVKYSYYPKAAPLDQEEMSEWKDITRKLVASGFQGKGQDRTQDNSDLIKRLLIQRSRIAKKAKAKVPIASKIITSRFNAGEYWLVYCEDMEQLLELDDRLKSEGYSAYIYATGMEGYPDEELHEYIQRGGIILSIRCLDEGIDIPKISHAVIMASSQNPRQFIQRRGRVLRSDGLKQKAEIFDLFSLPSSDQADVTKSLIESEIRRGAEFACSAVNKELALFTLQKFLIDLGIGPANFDDPHKNQEDLVDEC